MDQNSQTTSGLNVLANIYQPGTLNIIGGRPGIGKTTLAFNLAVDVDQPTVYFSLEQSAMQLRDRHSPTTGLGLIHIDDTVPMTLEVMRVKLLQIQKCRPFRFVIIDYLQLMHSYQKYPNRKVELTAIAEGLKSLALEFKVAVIALSSLSRSEEKRENRIPVLKDFREWEGEIPPCVDDVRLIYRPEYYCIKQDSHGSTEDIWVVLSTERHSGDIGNLRFKIHRYKQRIEYFTQESVSLLTAKTIIIPVGFNAEQCQEDIMNCFTSDDNTEWMDSGDFVVRYLYCQEDGDYDPPLEVWLLVWDSPGKMINPPHGGCSSLYVHCLAVSVNLAWCKNHHKGLTVRVIKVLPPATGGKSPIIKDSWFGHVVNHFHTVDYQEEMAHASPNMPFGEFLNRMDEKIAGIVKGK